MSHLVGRWIPPNEVSLISITFNQVIALKFSVLGQQEHENHFFPTPNDSSSFFTHFCSIFTLSEANSSPLTWAARLVWRSLTQSLDLSFKSLRGRTFSTFVLLSVQFGMLHGCILSMICPSFILASIRTRKSTY